MRHTVWVVVAATITVNELPERLFAQESTAAPQQQVMVFHIASADVKNVARSLEEILGGDSGVRIVTEMTSNSLVVRGSADEIRQVREVLTVIDRPPQMVTLDVVIAATEGDEIDVSGDSEAVANRIEGLSREGQISILNRLHLATLENIASTVQLGQDTPVVTGYSYGGRSPQGSPVRQTRTSNVSVGTVFQVTARVEDGQTIVMQQNIEKSWFESLPAADTEGRDTAADSGQTRMNITSQSTVRIRSGESVVLRASKTTGISKNVVVIVTARLGNENPPRVAQRSAVRARPTGQAIPLKYVDAREMARAVTLLFDADELSVSVDVRSNALLVRPRSNENRDRVLKQVRELVDRLDSTQPETEE